MLTLKIHQIFLNFQETFVCEIVLKIIEESVPTFIYHVSLPQKL